MIDVSNQISNSDDFCLDISMKVYDVFDFRLKRCKTNPAKDMCTRNNIM